MPTTQDGAARRVSYLGAAERQLAEATNPRKEPRPRELRSSRLLVLAVPLAIATAASGPAAAASRPPTSHHLNSRGTSPQIRSGTALASFRSAIAPSGSSSRIKSQFTAASLTAARLAAADAAKAGKKVRSLVTAQTAGGHAHTTLTRKSALVGSKTALRLETRPASPGSVAAFGDAAPAGEHRTGSLNIVGVAPAHCQDGYWALDTRGRVFAYGCAQVYGSITKRPPGGAAAIAAAPGGHGYWVVSHDGDVYSFGGAGFYGSLGNTSLPGEVVGIAPTPAGRGYWLVTARGGVYSFGDARFFGSLGSRSVASPVVGIAPSPHANGYWLATAGGGVFSFGGAKFFGAGAHMHHGAVITAVASTPTGQGYWLLTASGRVFPFGHAPRFGFVSTRAGTEASSLAATQSGKGLVVATDVINRRAAGVASGLGATDGATLQGPQQGTTESPLRYLGTFMVTCYDLAGVTATGAIAGPESVAVDPSVIPLGTRIYVQGVGMRTADDTGGAIIGNHIDIWEPAYTTCADWGVQEKAVYAVPGQ